MAIVRQNRADVNVAAATGVTAANSGGARAGDPWDTVVTNAGFNYKDYKGSAVGSPNDGGFIYENVNPTGATAYGEWNLTLLEFWGSGYWEFYPNPVDGGTGTGAGTTVFLMALGASDVQAAKLQYVTSTGKVQVGGINDVGLVATTSTAGPTSKWLRIDWHFKLHASAGVAEARVYFNPLTAPNTYETITETTATTLGTMTKLRIGVLNIPGAYLYHIYDDILIDDRGWIERRLHPVSRMGRALSS